MYVRMAHGQDRRFLRLKNDGSSPTLTAIRVNKPTVTVFRDNVRTENTKLIKHSYNQLNTPKLTEYPALIQLNIQIN